MRLAECGRLVGLCFVGLGIFACSGVRSDGEAKPSKQAAPSSQAAKVAPPEDRYVKRVEMIPMRDGVRLYTEVYTPREQGGPLPIIFLRTPYGVANASGGFTRYFRSTFRELAKEGYLFAVQDARGRHRSEGKFEWNRPVRHRRDPNAIDASTDAYDAIDWLVKKLPNNNGRVGMLGVSYPGWYVAMALVDPHPALRAASPQASPSDYFVGDDFFHFGAFRLSPSAELPYLFDFDPKRNSRFPYDQVDTYEFFLELGPLANMNRRYLKGVSPTWNNFMAHSSYDEYWKLGGTLQHLDSVSVPTLHVVGWWDAENLGGALDIYDRVEPFDRKGINKIVVGPWAHGQWAGGPRSSLGAYDFGSDTLAFYQQEVEAPWFAHHLKDQASPELPEALMFQSGSNRWLRYAAWPPKRNVRDVRLYLRPDGLAAFAAPRAKHAQPSSEAKPSVATEGGGVVTSVARSQAAREGVDFVQWVSDPAKPVPYSKRPIQGFWSGLRGSKDPRFGRAGKLWKVEDQRFVSDRPDVVSFVTAPLEEDIELVGKITARLFCSTSGTDSDWVVKLIDVYPERYPAKIEMGGYQLMVADDVIRAKFRDSLSEPKAVVPNRVTEYTIDLRTRNHMFRKGHRIMVQIQSTWFPLIDRNPQRFCEIPKAEAEDFQKATQRVYFNASYPSRIEFTVAERR